MKRICLSIVVASTILLIASCHNAQQPTVAASLDTATTANNKFIPAMMDNKKDLNCGMPLSAGIGDTAHYKGKVYGFCSTECKNAFLANPDSLLAKNK